MRSELWGLASQTNVLPEKIKSARILICKNRKENNVVVVLFFLKGESKLKDDLGSVIVFLSCGDNMVTVPFDRVRKKDSLSLSLTLSISLLLC